MSWEHVDESISLFVFKVMKQHGTEYPINSLHSLASFIRRYLKTQLRKHSRFFKDKDCFSRLRSSLDTVLKERTAAGTEEQCGKVELISVDEDDCW